MGINAAKKADLLIIFSVGTCCFGTMILIGVVKEEMSRTFHPPVATRIGLHMILYSLSLLSKANDPCCKRAWSILEQRRGSDGKYVIDCSLTKPYIKTEKPGKPSKWVTFYALAAKKRAVPI